MYFLFNELELNLFLFFVALSKYNVAQETNQKMTDTLKVTQFKVLQSQAAIEW